MNGEAVFWIVYAVLFGLLMLIINYVLDRNGRSFWLQSAANWIKLRNNWIDLGFLREEDYSSEKAREALLKASTYRHRLLHHKLGGIGKNCQFCEWDLLELNYVKKDLEVKGYHSAY